MNILRKIRIGLAIAFLAVVTLLFLDFTGSVHGYLGWVAKIQLLPALLALNVGVVVGLVVLTLLLGRVYCSVICPLGVFQDLVSKFNKKKHKYAYSPAKKWLRHGVLAVLIVAFVAGVGSVVVLLDPYSAFGRIASNLFAPFYQWSNNLLAYFAERVDNYAFYTTDVWIKSIGAFVVTILSTMIVVVLAWNGGRTYCNTICPVGTILGFLSKWSLYKHRFDIEKCNGCGSCARNCKASCIDTQSYAIDYSRCVVCFDCINKCNKNAIVFTPCVNKKQEVKAKNIDVDTSRRDMIAVAGTLLVSSAVMAQDKNVDGGLAHIEDKKIPKRQTPIAPAGARSIRNLSKRCTGCQLCVSACPNQVLRPSTGLTNFMQPEMSYERGYCRPECTKCTEVCPTGAITPITEEDKSSIQIGHAVWVEKNCVVLTDGVSCGNCARHCPTGAITMIEKSAGSLDSAKIPMVDTERCIGCGACEYLCPARPFSAIYVEGHLMHKIV